MTLALTVSPRQGGNYEVVIEPEPASGTANLNAMWLCANRGVELSGCRGVTSWRMENFLAGKPATGRRWGHNSWWAYPLFRENPRRPDFGVGHGVGHIDYCKVRESRVTFRVS